MTSSRASSMSSGRWFCASRSVFIRIASLLLLLGKPVPDLSRCAECITRKEGAEVANLVSSSVERRAAARIAAAHPRAADQAPHPGPAGDGAALPRREERARDRPPPGQERKTGPPLDQDLLGNGVCRLNRPAPGRPDLTPDPGDPRGRPPGVGER